MPTSSTVTTHSRHSTWDSPSRLALLCVLVGALAATLGALSLITNSSPARAAQVNQVIIRAEGRSGVEQMQLLLNDEPVAEWVVGTDAADYVYSPGETIDVNAVEVRFANDRGNERDLKVDYVDLGGTILQSEDPATVSSGTYVRGEGCVQRSSVSDQLHCNGSFVYAVPQATTVESAPQSDEVIVAVRAMGSTGVERVQIEVNDTVVATETLTTNFQTLSYAWPADTPITSAGVQFLNDSGPRDVRVDYLEVDGIRYESEDENTFSTGAFFDGSCGEGYVETEWLRCNGGFSYAISGAPVALPEDPDPVEDGDDEDQSEEPASDAVEDDDTDQQDAPVSGDNIEIAVRALGSTGVEQIEIEINGTVIATETLTTSYQTLSYPWPADTAVTSAEVAFINDSGPRDVRVDYIEVDGTRYQSEDADTFSTGIFFNGSCGGTFTTREWLYCEGAFVYAIGGESGVVAEDIDPVEEEETEEDESEEQDEQDQDDSGDSAEPADEESDPVSDDDIEIIVRARGTTGAERVQITINGTVIATETLTTSYQNYTYPWPADTRVTNAEVAYINNAGLRDARIDYLQVDGTRYQSEDTETYGTGVILNGRCTSSFATSEWLYCNGSFIYPVGGVPAVDQPESEPEEPARAVGENDSSSDDESDSDSGDQDPPRQVGSSGGRYSISQVIEGTISTGDGSNPNEEAPAGRHDASLAINQGWNWAQGPTRNSVWGQLGTGNSRFAEFRCAVIPESGHTPPVPFRVNVREGAYYQYANGNWQTGFNVDLTGGNHGGYLGTAGQQGGNPFNEGSHGLIDWRRESDGSFSAPWNSSALMMHFWAAQRKAPASGQTAEFLTSEVRLQQPDGQTVDLSKVRVLFQCGVDYYSTTGGQGTQVPGPGIGKYHRATTEWQPSLWVTLPNGTAANSVSDFRNWLESNTPPNVG